MRVVILGASAMAVETARILIERDHEVILVESDRNRIDELRESLDCSFLHGDGSKPEILKETSPEDADLLFCLTESDQANIIASLVGRSLGFEKMVTRIQDVAYEAICAELGLEDVIVPSRTIARYLGDMAEGIDVLELRTVIRGDARFFMLTAGPEEKGSVAELDLPEEARVVCLYRDDAFHMVDEDTRLREGDEVVVLTDVHRLQALKERWAPGRSEDAEH